MSDGYFIGKGNKTTCGGEVLDGDAQVLWAHILHACEGDRVTCGKDGGTYRIVGGVSHIISGGRRVAGTLDSRSDCPCRAELIPSDRTITYGNNHSERRTAQPEPSAVSRRSVATSQSGFAPSSMSPSASAGIEPQEPGFYVVPKSMTREALEATLFGTRDEAVMRRFHALNPGLGDVKAGSIIVLSDPNNTSCIFQEAQLMDAADQVKAALDPLTPDEADFMHRHAAEIASFTGQTSTWLGVSAAVMEQHLKGVRDTLLEMERLHQNTYIQHGHLRTPRFFQERQRLLSQLDAHLLNSTRLRGHTTLGDHPKLKTALGISSRSLVHHWDKAGGPGQIKGYATHVDAASRAAKYMQAGGYIGIGIGGVSALLAVQEVCNGGSGEACQKIRFTEGGKFVGATAGGAAGAWLGASVSGAICLALGATTAIGGVVCAGLVIGTGSWVGATYIGEGGEYVGEMLYESSRP